jgi:hypothetical protein
MFSLQNRARCSSPSRHDPRRASALFSLLHRIAKTASIISPGNLQRRPGDTVCEFPDKVTLYLNLPYLAVIMRLLEMIHEALSNNVVVTKRLPGTPLISFVILTIL